MEVAIPHLKWLSEWLANILHVVYLVDRDGIILFSTGNYGDADPSGLSPGYDWSERTMGTNGAGRSRRWPSRSGDGTRTHQQPLVRSTCRLLRSLRRGA
jgi:hypothetical protein